MSDNIYDQRIRYNGSGSVHAATGVGVSAYAHTACDVTIIRTDIRLDSNAEVTCRSCIRVLKEE